MLIGSQKDLLSRVSGIYSHPDPQRSLAILAGSGLTASVIANARRIVELVRRGLDADDQADLDAVTGQYAEDSEKYQATFSFLALRKSPEYRDRVVRLATLGAYKNTIKDSEALSNQRLNEYESDVDDWKLPAGVEALGRLWAGTPSAIRGPILTTNFDPLCEIGIRRAGAVAITNVIDTDGSFLRDVRISNEPHVVHFHGYWRESSTLSMMSQLTQERPALAGSLRGLLRRSTMLVVGYGGWRDALTAQILEAIREQESTALDILWCYYGKVDELQAEFATNAVLQQLSLAPGNVQFYAGIDTNSFFPELEKKCSDYLRYSDAPRRSIADSVLLGWSLVPPRVSSRTKAAEQSAALAFFDGRLPNWGDASSVLVPLREVSISATNQVSRAILDGESSLSLIVGPSGEGKSTALMQIGFSLSEKLGGRATVMFHPDGALPRASEVLALPATRTNVIILDEAGKCVDRIRELVEHINANGRNDIHLVVAARSTDWQNAGGAGYAWQKHIRTFRHDVVGITRADAVSIIDAWTRIGPDALGALTTIPGHEARVQALLLAAQGSGSEGALLGALLETRYGAQFGDHVVDLMQRLSHWQVPFAKSDHTLLDAFLLIAYPHALGVGHLSPRLLAQALDVSEDELYHSVLPQLGDEAAVTYSRNAVLVRHKRIAHVAVERSFEVGLSLEDVVTTLVQAAVSLIAQEGYEADLSHFAYLARRIDDRSLAVVAARAAVDASPSRLSYRTSLSRALRRDGKSSDACQLAEETLSGLLGSEDLKTGARPFFTEWGVAEGYERRPARNAVLAGLALQDVFVLGELIPEQFRGSLACLAVAFRKLAELFPNEREYERAVAAVAELASRGSLADRGASWVLETEAWLDARGMRGVGLTTKDAIASVGRALEVATRSVEKPLPPSLPSMNLRFTALSAFADE